MTKSKGSGKVFFRGQERSGSADSDKLKAKQNRVDSEDKLGSLKQYRRKNGFCFKCGGKWSTTHTCPEHVPLHVIEELLDALEFQPSEDSEELQSEILASDDIVMAVQLPDKEVTGHRQTLKLLAHIGKQQVLILVDSGSIGTFVSDRLVRTLGLTTEQCPLSTFKAADGGQLQCSHRVPSLQWWIQGHAFKSDAKVLNLRC
jgi:hypothetical protein